MKSQIQPKHGYLAIGWIDEYGVPTGLCASYYHRDPGDREYVLKLWNQSRSFQLFGDFADIDSCKATLIAGIKQMALAIPIEERQKWPCKEDYDYIETCDVCGFTYCPRLPKDVESHDKHHAGVEQ